MISQQWETQLVFQDNLLSYRKGTAVIIAQVDLKLMASSAFLCEVLGLQVSTSVPHWLRTFLP